MNGKQSVSVYGGSSTDAISIASHTVNAVMATDIAYIMTDSTLSLIFVYSLLTNAGTLTISKRIEQIIM
jgi:hypothetical protein